MKKHHWLLVLAIVLAVIAFFRSPWAIVPAALLFALWAHEAFSLHDVAGLTPRGARARALGLCPWIRVARRDEVTWKNRRGEVRPWRGSGAGVTGYGRDRLEAFDDWEAQL